MSDFEVTVILLLLILLAVTLMDLLIGGRND